MSLLVDSATVLSERLDAVRRRERRAAVLAGGLRALVLALGLVLGFFLIDWLVISRVGLTDDRWARGILVLGLAVVLARALWRGVVRPLLSVIDDDTVALRVESRHGELRGRLIATIQLARSGVGGCSQDLLEAMAKDTVSITGAMDFGDIIDWRTLRQMALWTAVCAAVAIAVGLWQRDYASSLFGRMTLSSGEYPTATRITDISENVRVPLGEDAQIDIGTAGQMPTQVALLVRPRGGGPAARWTATGAAHAWRVTVVKVVEDLEYRPVAGDARFARWIPLTVARRPAVAGLDLTVRSPAYARRQDLQTTVADIQALEGSLVTVRARFTKALATAELVVREVQPAGAQEKLRTIPVTLATDGTSGVAELAVERPGTWWLRITDRDGLDDRIPPMHLLGAVPDAPPAVVVTFPTQDRTVTRRARWPLRFTAKDDVGLAGAELKLQMLPLFSDNPGQDSAKASSQAEASVRTLPITGFPPTGSATASAWLQADGGVVLDLEPLDVAVDTRLVWWIEVRDSRQPTPGIARSQPRAFTIADERTVRDMLDRERDQQLQRLEAVAGFQREARAGVESIRSATAATVTGTPP